MGIIKNLGNAAIKLIGGTFKVASVWPLPEYLVCVSTIIDTLIILDDAYKAESTVGTIMMDGEEWKCPVSKKGPADVWSCVMPGADKWSIREAVKTYKELDDTGKMIFSVSAVSVGLKALALVLTSFRFFTIMEDNKKYRTLYRKEAAVSKNNEEYLRSINNSLDCIIDSLKNKNHNMDTVNERVHFNNYIAIKNDVECMYGEMDLIRRIA